MQKIKNNMAEVAWVLGILFCSLGVCFSAKSGLGVSMVVAPAYVLYQKISQYFSWFTFGMSEYCLQGILVAMLSVVLRRFKWKYVLSFLVAVIHGSLVDLWNNVFSFVECDLLFERWAFCILGGVVTSFAISLMLRTYLPQEAYEVVVKEISDKYNFSFNKVKWIYDISSLVFSIILMLLLFGEFSFEMIGAGTLFLTVFNAPMITLYGKFNDKFFTFSPISPNFHKKFNRLFN